MGVKVKNKKNVKVIIVGAGRIGITLADHLSETGCEVTIIDKELPIINHINNSLDIICLRGNGASYDVLQEVDAANADIYISVTGSDELNILGCMTAHLLGSNRTIARVRSIDYAMQSKFFRDKLGLSMTINPELATAKEIWRLIRFPSATRIELFAHGRAELIELRVTSSNIIVGKSLIEINQNLKINLLICAVVRNDEVLIPNGEFIINDGDTLYITGATKEFAKSFKKMNLPVKPLNSVLIAGGGTVTYYLASQLNKAGANVTVVEEHHDTAVKIADNLKGISVICDDAMEYFDSLSDSSIKNIDAFVALTDSDEYNLIMGMFAESKQLDKVITKMDSQSKLLVLSRGSRICNVSIEDVASDYILGYARSLLAASEEDAIESLYRLMDGKIEFTEFKIRENEPHLEKTLKELTLKPQTLVACIIRETQTIIPRGDDFFKLGDTVIVVTINKQIARLQDIFDI